MVDTRIVLSASWVATMLTYLLGDVLRIFAGDVTLGEIDGVVPSQGVWLGMDSLRGLQVCRTGTQEGIYRHRRVNETIRMGRPSRPGIALRVLPNPP